MEKITIYFRSGDVKEYTGKLTSTSLTGNNLMVTEKETTKTIFRESFFLEPRLRY